MNVESLAVGIVTLSLPLRVDELSAQPLYDFVRR